MNPTSQSKYGKSIARLGHRGALINADTGLRLLDLLLASENRVLHAAMDSIAPEAMHGSHSNNQPPSQRMHEGISTQGCPTASQVGIVSIPGMMTGQILSGADPSQARDSPTVLPSMHDRGVSLSCKPYCTAVAFCGAATHAVQLSAVLPSVGAMDTKPPLEAVRGSAG